MLAKVGCTAGAKSQVTEGVVRKLWKRLRAGQRKVVGLGGGRAPRWGCRSMSRYIQARTGQGNVGAWKARLGRGGSLRRLCQEGMIEKGDHLVFECVGTLAGVG